ncbi:MAG TPA: hypothetical protein VF120_01105 [Ktedonobacterales bacterium]
MPASSRYRASRITWAAYTAAVLFALLALVLLPVWVVLAGRSIGRANEEDM